MALWMRRMTAWRRLRTTAALYYSHEYIAPCLYRGGRVCQAALSRATLAVGELARRHLLRPGSLRIPRPATIEQLARVHTLDYLDASETPETLAAIFGLPADMMRPPELVRAARMATGGTIAAAHRLRKGPHTIAINLGGGFHHAKPHRGEGFCIYNDIATAIGDLRTRGYNAPIAIVDLDFHPGNGNQAAFAGDPSVLTYSIHGTVWGHERSANDVPILLPPGTNDAEYLAALKDTLGPALRAHKPVMIFFIAGNDVLEGDELGDFVLTAAGVFTRDRHVFELAAAIGAKVVVTLGGGYGHLAWQCTVNLADWILTGHEPRDFGPEAALQAHYDRVARELTPSELQRDTLGIQFTEEDILGDLSPVPPARRVLDFYSVQGLELALERYGFFAAIRAKGFEEVRIDADFKDPTRQLLRVTATRPETGPTRHLLVELVLRRQFVTLPGGDAITAEVLVIEWLLAQDPSRSFTPERPALPGQEKPGLGLATEIMELLIRMAGRLRLEGILNRPAHYHTAFLVRNRFFYMDPVEEGRFRAFQHVLAGYPLPASAAIIAARGVVTSTGAPFPWVPADHLMPLSDRLRAHFLAPAYVAAAAAERDRFLAAGLHVRSEAAQRFATPSRENLGRTPA